MFLRLGGLLALVEFGHRLLQHFRMSDEVFANDGANLVALRGRELGRRGALHQRRNHEGGADGGDAHFVGHREASLSVVSCGHWRVAACR
jgi:hypothetical protein